MKSFEWCWDPTTKKSRLKNDQQGCHWIHGWWQYSSLSSLFHFFLFLYLTFTVKSNLYHWLWHKVCTATWVETSLTDHILAPTCTGVEKAILHGEEQESPPSHTTALCSSIMGQHAEHPKDSFHLNSLREIWHFSIISTLKDWRCQILPKSHFHWAGTTRE